MLKEIKKSLQAIVNPTAGVEIDLGTAIKNLDEILAKEDKNLDPKIKHFLQNRSYEKALLWVEGVEPERGNCGK